MSARPVIQVGDRISWPSKVKGGSVVYEGDVVCFDGESDPVAKCADGHVRRASLSYDDVRLVEPAPIKAPESNPAFVYVVSLMREDWSEVILAAFDREEWAEELQDWLVQVDSSGREPLERLGASSVTITRLMRVHASEELIERENGGAA